MVDTSSFEVGRNIAVTPGAVVLRTEVLELIQYRPQTERVREVPLLIVPPTINKYYAIDLAPGRSLVEYLVQNGQQVFVISWRNPDARHAWLGHEYLRPGGARRARCRPAGIRRRPDRADRNLRRRHHRQYHRRPPGRRGEAGLLSAFGLFVTVLDTAQAGLLGALTDRRLALAAKAMSRRRGYLDGRDLAEVFAWLRPGDLVWNYWVNNYLLGKKPPAFDILFWNADTTRMSAGLHGDFVDLAIDSKLVTPGALTVLGTPIDLSQVDTDACIVAGIADHITPWQNCYRSIRLLGGKSRFTLSTSGHIAALVNPPGNQKARYQINESTPADPEDWLKTAETEQGSWWTDLLAWLGERCGTVSRPRRTRRWRTAADRRRAGHVRLGHLTGVQRAGRGHRGPGHRRRGAVPAPGRPHPAAPLAGHLPRAADPGRDPPPAAYRARRFRVRQLGELRPRRPGQAAAARAAGQRPRPDGRAPCQEGQASGPVSGHRPRRPAPAASPGDGRTTSCGPAPWNRCSGSSRPARKSPSCPAAAWPHAKANGCWPAPPTICGSCTGTACRANDPRPVARQPRAKVAQDRGHAPVSAFQDSRPVPRRGFVRRPETHSPSNCPTVPRAVTRDCYAANDAKSP